MILQLCSRIWKNDQFQNDLLSFREESLQAQLGLRSSGAFSAELVTSLLQAAATLSASENDGHREAAYDIATGVFTGYRELFSGTDELLYLTLARLGNFPAMGLFQGDTLPPSSLPLMARMESLSRRMDNSIQMTSDLELTVTDFQKSVWNRLVAGDSVSLSAPTSTGKSFVLISFLRRFLASRVRLHAVYLVPTRALINQISTKLIMFAGQDGTDATRIVTVPLAADQSIVDGTVFVLTQERLQVLMQNHPKLAFAIAIADEAQTIGDGPRGILLQSALDEIIARNDQVQLFFAAPFIDNPGVFAGLFPRPIVSEISTTTAVTQNIIIVNRRLTRQRN